MFFWQLNWLIWSKSWFGAGFRRPFLNEEVILKVLDIAFNWLAPYSHFISVQVLHLKTCTPLVIWGIRFKTWRLHVCTIWFHFGAVFFWCTSSGEMKKFCLLSTSLLLATGCLVSLALRPLLFWVYLFIALLSNYTYMLFVFWLVFDHIFLLLSLKGFLPHQRMYQG